MNQWHLFPKKEIKKNHCKCTYWGNLFGRNTEYDSSFSVAVVTLSEETDLLSSSRRRGSITVSHCVWLSASSRLTGAGLVTAIPVQELFSLKPQLDFPLSPFQWIAGMDHIPLSDQTHTSLFFLPPLQKNHMQKMHIKRLLFNPKKYCAHYEIKWQQVTCWHECWNLLWLCLPGPQLG